MINDHMSGGETYMLKLPVGNGELEDLTLHTCLADSLITHTHTHTHIAWEELEGSSP